MNKMGKKTQDCIRYSWVLLFSVTVLMQANQTQASLARPVLDFEIRPDTPGSMSYINSGDSTPDAFIGVGIQVDSVYGINTAENSGVVSTCVNCSLDFSTGPLTSHTLENGLDIWYFQSGGSINITGGVDFANGVDIASGTTLLTGAFQSAAVVKLSTGYYDFRVAAGSFTDTKNEDLLLYYGLPIGSVYEGGFNLSFSAEVLDNNGFQSIALFSGDITNSPVPIPGAAWLLGSGIIGLAGLRTRKKK